MTLALFLPDGFSRRRPHLKLATPRSRELVEAFIKHHHRTHIGAVATCHQVSGVPIEDAASIQVNASAFKIEAQNGAWLLKRVVNPNAARNLDKQAALLQWLADRGLPVVVPLSSDTGAVAVPDGPGQWVLTPFVEGDYYSGGEKEVSGAGEAIGRLFQQLQRWPSSQALPVRHYFEGMEARRLAAMEDCRPRWSTTFKPAEYECLSAGWTRVRKVAEEVAAADRLRNLEESVCHFDLHPHNLLMQHGSIAAILDFDACGRMPEGIALAFAMQKLVRQAVVARREGGDQVRPHNLAREFIGAVGRRYAKTYSWRDLALFAKVELLRRLLSVCAMRMEGQAFVFGGPEVHLAGLFEIDEICATS